MCTVPRFVEGSPGGTSPTPTVYCASIEGRRQSPGSPPDAVDPSVRGPGPLIDMNETLSSDLLVTAPDLRVIQGSRERERLLTFIVPADRAEEARALLTVVEGEQSASS